ncbi:MAG: helix-turn-helix domain-containing protein [Clostridia bacterium]|nr:helix-turn-helix domain-containing protein [Clostridia bacterium]
MFWERFFYICSLNKQSPNFVCSQLGLSTATATHWKNGAIPKADVLLQISNYFNCSTDFLLGKTEEITEISNNNEFSDKEKRLITAYRDKPEVQIAVDRLLGLEEGEILNMPNKPTNTARIAAFGGGVFEKTYKEGELNEKLINELIEQRKIKFDEE